MKNVAIAVLAFLVLATAADAKSIYVAPSGSDGASGTSSFPVKTIAKGVALASPGDTVVARDGIYPGVVQIGKSGTSKSPIKIAAEHKGMAIIDGGSTSQNADLVVITGSYVTFDGFAVRNATRSGIAVWAARNVTISNNTVTGSTRGGIWAGAGGLGQSTQIQITGNLVVNNCLENIARDWDGGWPRAIGVDVSTAVTISGNTVTRNYGEGIGYLSTSGSKITGNAIFDNYSVEVYLDNAPTSTVTGNLIFSTGDTKFYRHDRPAFGVLVANENTQFPMASNGIRATGNALLGADPATYVGPDTYSGTVVTNSTFSPNTVIGQ